MFYCNPCGVVNGWPETFYKSRGLCEECGSCTICNDRPAEMLPGPIVSVIDDTSIWW